MSRLQRSSIAHAQAYARAHARAHALAHARAQVLHTIYEDTPDHAELPKVRRSSNQQPHRYYRRLATSSSEDAAERLKSTKNSGEDVLDTVDLTFANQKKNNAQ